MKQKLFLLLSVLFVLNIFRFGFRLVPHFFLIVLTACATDYLSIKLRKIQPFFPLASLDTGIVIGLIYKITTPELADLSKKIREQ